MENSPAIDIQVVPIGPDTLTLRSRSWSRLKFEIEYGLQRGTTANSYLISGSNRTALIDPPGAKFKETFLEALQARVSLSQLDYVILGHVNPNRAETLMALLDLAPKVTLVCSNPAAQILPDLLPGYDPRLKVMRGEDALVLGRLHILQFIPTPNPRWPDSLCTYDLSSQILFTDKYFGAHVCGDQVFDEGFPVFEEDRRYYFDCVLAPYASQVEKHLEKFSDFPAQFMAPAHGPMLRYGLTDLVHNYQSWCQQQKEKDLSVALLYASAYGNTTTLAQAIARGINKAGLQVTAINCENADTEEMAAVIEHSDGFVIGSPTLGGHAPTQIQSALGTILSTATKVKLAGVFGSYGWSGEAIDLLEGKLRDAGFQFGFDTIRVKFKPDEVTLKHCEEAGTDFAQALKRLKKVRQYRQRSQPESQVDRTAQAVGRIVGSLCIVTAREESVSSAMLASWVSQATFDPPGITVAVAKDRAVESLLHPEGWFVLNVLSQDNHLDLMKHFLKPFRPGEDRFEGVDTLETACQGIALAQALSYLDCKVVSRMDCGDHWVVYAQVDHGEVLDQDGLTAVHQRKSGKNY
ncbi:diflavin flavoprotein [Lyngbya confervoides]|uniref:Diflavin flavoprotein n=1 Tax=Lyngbya confervoides BDU141951 TaxID=1574623 RepID=A0ABD4T5B5_9CYAN|nr:diflavin flavoprotein [Lyngbya confervoides]MCM1983608.1 diflavin flavoprotein [Lyngbya confervoides BDU141951]